MLRKLSKEKRAYSWGIADQVLSSLTNFILGILVARTVSLTDFGIFHVGFVTYLLALGVSRAVSTDPLSIRYSTRSEATWRQGVSAASGMSAWIGIAIGLGCVLFGIIVGGHMGSVFVALGLMMPGLLIQDIWRGAFFAARKGHLAFLNDLIWTIALVIGLVFYFGAGRSSVAGLVLIWGGSATLAGIVSAVIGGTHPALPRALAWWREHKEISLRFFGEFVTYRGTNQMAMFGVAGIAGFAATGSLRAAQILLNPMHTLQLGLASVAIPEGAKSLASGGIEKLRRSSLVITALLGPTILVWGAALFLLPHSVGTAILGENWEPARSVLIPKTIATAAAAASVGAITGLRALAAAKRSYRVRLIVSLEDLGTALLAAAIWGVLGVAWAAASSSVLGLGLWWWQFKKGLSEYRGPDKDSQGQDSPDPRSLENTVATQEV